MLRNRFFTEIKKIQSFKVNVVNELIMPEIIDRNMASKLMNLFKQILRMS